MWRFWQIYLVLIPGAVFGGWTMNAFTNPYAWGTSITATGTVREHEQVVTRYEGTNAPSVWTNTYWRFDSGATSNNYTETDGSTYTNTIVDVGVPDRTNTFLLRGRDVAMWELYKAQLERTPVLYAAGVNPYVFGGAGINGINYGAGVSFYWHSEYIANMINRKAWVANFLYDNWRSPWLCTTNLGTNGEFDGWIKATTNCSIPKWDLSRAIDYLGCPTNYFSYTPTWPAQRVTTNNFEFNKSSYIVKHTETNDYYYKNYPSTYGQEQIVGTFGDEVEYVYTSGFDEYGYRIYSTGVFHFGSVITTEVFYADIVTNIAGAEGQVVSTVLTNANIQEGFSGSDYLNPEHLRAIVNELRLVRVSPYNGLVLRKTLSRTKYNEGSWTSSSTNGDDYLGFYNWSGVGGSVRDLAESASITESGTDWYRIDDSMGFTFYPNWTLGAEYVGPGLIGNATFNYTLQERIPDDSSDVLRINTGDTEVFIATNNIKTAEVYYTEPSVFYNKLDSPVYGQGDPPNWYLAFDTNSMSYTDPPYDVYNTYRRPVGYYTFDQDLLVSNEVFYTQIDKILISPVSQVLSNYVLVTNVYSDPAVSYDFPSFVLDTGTLELNNWGKIAGDAMSWHEYIGAWEMMKISFFGNTQPFVIIEYEFEYED